ncbi:hypothetical protein CBR_g31454 [Chara braunii]|uniref:Uncharacterized protein n=1 Tax=Chara braunii TaxID=69332 RepID=A0A388LF20_CHABU|nr:hypothetical protein CBR_g31454 [Chara braunii]|eukprot:GBG80898.1 hypothetical protein CBR_g31454 [Chara braunii]
MSVLRLLCLFSITGGGVPKKQFEYFRRELLQTYGYEHLFTLNNLEKAGLFRVQEGKSPWPLIKKSLRLAVEDNDDSNPKDIAYVYSGYAPMSIRLVQHALKGGWGAIDETLRLLPGPAFQKKQLLDASIQSDSPADHFHYENAGAGQDGRRSLVLVVFIGGVTFAEISALRFLSKQEDMKCDFIVATTKLVNGSSLLETLTDDPLSLR